MHGARPLTSRDGVFDSSALSYFEGHVATWQSTLLRPRRPNGHIVSPAKRRKQRCGMVFVLCIPVTFLVGSPSFVLMAFMIRGWSESQLALADCGVLNAQHVEDKALYRSQATRDWGTSPSNAAFSTGGGKPDSKC